MSTTLHHTSEIVTTTCWCGMPHGIPKSLDDMQRLQWENNQQQVTIYCPAGHTYIRSGRSPVRRELDNTKAQLDRARTYANELRDQRDHERRRVSSYRGVVAKTKKRVGNGVCPCCTRSFANLKRHMAGQHPDYAKSTEDAK